MKYKLHIVQNNEQKVWVYDNDSNLFYDENGNELLSQFEQKPYTEIKPFTRQHNPYRKKRKGVMIEILLGLACNFDCKYCSQRLIRDKAHNAKPSDVEPFINMLLDAQVEPYQFQLWGGEPLVYWKTIEVLVPELRKYWPNASIYFPTNGSLLTKEKIDFIKKYDIQFSISHDGCFDNNRDYDILNDDRVMEAIKYARQTLRNGQLSFGATLQKEALVPQKVIKFFRDKVDSKINVGVHNVVRCHNSADYLERECANISQDKLDEFTESIFRMLNDPNPDPYEHSYKNLRDRLVNTWINKRPKSAIGAECGQPLEDSFCVDMLGNLFQCHSYNVEHPQGHISKLDEYEPVGYSHWSNRQKCVDCLVIHSCRGGCPSSDDLAKDLSCPNLYAQHYGVFKGAVANLFGVYLSSVEPYES